MEALTVGPDKLSNMDLLRLAMPRVGGLEFTEEAGKLRFFSGRLGITSDWQDKLVGKFRDDFPDSL